MEPYRGFDFMGIEESLTEEERRIRDTVREFVEREALPLIPSHFRDGTFPMELWPRMAEMGLMGAPHRGLRLRWGQPRGLRPHHAGAGAWRLGPPLLPLCPILAGYERALHAWLRRAERALLAGDGGGPGAGRLRPDGAGARQRPRRHGDPRRAGQRRLPNQRLQVLDHSRSHRPLHHRVGKDRRRHPGLYRGAGYARAIHRRRSRTSSPCG